jgi:hypothetical protein
MGDFGGGLRGISPLLRSPRPRCASGVLRAPCGAVTFGLGEQILAVLAGDFEMDGWMQGHVDTPRRGCGYVCAVTVAVLSRDRTGESAGPMGEAPQLFLGPGTIDFHLREGGR